MEFVLICDEHGSGPLSALEISMSLLCQEVGSAGK